MFEVFALVVLVLVLALGIVVRNTAANKRREENRRFVELLAQETLWLEETIELLAAMRRRGFGMEVAWELPGEQLAVKVRNFQADGYEDLVFHGVSRGDNLARLKAAFQSYQEYMEDYNLRCSRKALAANKLGLKAE